MRNKFDMQLENLSAQLINKRLQMWQKQFKKET